MINCQTLDVRLKLFQIPNGRKVCAYLLSIVGGPNRQGVGINGGLGFKKKL